MEPAFLFLLLVGSLTTVTPTSPTPTTTPSPFVMDDVILMGGYNGSRVLSIVFQYDATDGHSTSLSHMKTSRCQFGAAAIGSHVYAVGGLNNTNTLKKLYKYLCETYSLPTPSTVYQDHAHAINAVEAFDLTTGTWRDVASMQVARLWHAVAVLDGYLYAIGGYDENTNSRLSSVERFDPTINGWTMCEAFPDARAEFAAATISDCIYAVGGFNGHGSIVASGYKYCRGNQHWAAIAPMAVAREAHSAAELDGQLYVCGGYRVSSCERYNPVTDSWNGIASLPSYRYYISMAAVNGDVYIFGGVHKAIFLADVLRYNVKADEWTYQANMPTVLFGQASVAIPRIN